MEVTEAAESTSEKEEEQVAVEEQSWLHLSSYTIFLFARFD
jgi:hypothetical protein